MKILVTGGAGFIGSHLCKRLLDEGSHVYCLDNFYTGAKRNIEPFLKNRKFTFIEHDVTQPFRVKADKIYHLACPASPVQYQKNPIKTMLTSVLGAVNALNLSEKLAGVPVLLASTSEVYGDPQVHPQSESYFGSVNTIGPRACYDEGKRAAETIFSDYYREKKIPVKIVRIFNTYGPNMAADDGRVISNFICQALKNMPITIYGNGLQTRSFCYVDDLVEGIIAMMHSGRDITGPVNLGNPEEFTILDAAKKVLFLAESKSELVFEPLPEDDPKRRCPDIGLAKRILNWEPKVKLDEGLTHTIRYFKNG